MTGRPGRRQRRARSREPLSAKRIRQLQDRVETTGQPGRIFGLTAACIDCPADGELILLPGRAVIGRIYHSDGCPALAGVVAWQPVPIEGDP